MTIAPDAPTIEAPDEQSTCTVGHGWCDGDCRDVEPVKPGDEEFQDELYHRGVVAFLPMLRFTRDGWKDLDDACLIVRHDENEGADSRPLIMFDYPYRECGPAMTAEQARVNAARLLNAADLLDPLPAGVMVTTAVNMRIGDELLTPDGWQKVNGLVLDGEVEHATAYTPQENMDAGNGWDFAFTDPVKVRRPLHGSCALLFQEPVR